MNAQDALDNAIAILEQSGGQYTDAVRNAVSIWVAEALAEARHDDEAAARLASGTDR